MAEKQKGKQGARKGAGARPGGLKRAAGSPKATTGRVRVRRQEAAYARVADERSERVRSEIQAAVDAASRIREQIEAKIEKGFRK
jgi:hypothetical protein